MGASLTMIDRHYGHLARDGREHAIRLLDELSAEQRPPRSRKLSPSEPNQFSCALAARASLLVSLCVRITRRP
jgi:hypothetical protein